MRNKMANEDTEQFFSLRAQPLLHRSSAQPLPHPAKHPKPPPVLSIVLLSRSLLPSGRPQWRWALGRTRGPFRRSATPICPCERSTGVAHSPTHVPFPCVSSHFW